VEAELELLDTFADICEISRNRPTLDEEDTDESVHSPREHFHSFLHSLDAEVEGLPPSFQTKIVRALRNYDVDTLEPGPELEEAVYRLFLALQRMENQVPVIPPVCPCEPAAPAPIPRAGKPARVSPPVRQLLTRLSSILLSRLDFRSAPLTRCPGPPLGLQHLVSD